MVLVTVLAPGSCQGGDTIQQLLNCVTGASQSGLAVPTYDRQTQTDKKQTERGARYVGVCSLH